MVVTTLALPPLVPDIVVVTTLLAVVLAVQPVQVVHGAFVPHGPLVQPLHVLGGHPDVPHQLVHGPFVQEPVESDAHGPHPLIPLPPFPKGPYPPGPGCQPGAPELLMNGLAVGAPVMVARDEYWDASDAYAELEVG